MGADVIKIESASAWDDIRTLFPWTDEVADPVELGVLLRRVQPREAFGDARPGPGRRARRRVPPARRQPWTSSSRTTGPMSWTTSVSTTDASLAAQPDVDPGQHGRLRQGGRRSRTTSATGPIIEMMSGLMSLVGLRRRDAPQQDRASPTATRLPGWPPRAPSRWPCVKRRRTGAGRVVDLAQREVVVADGRRGVRAAWRCAARSSPRTGQPQRAAGRPRACYRVRGRGPVGRRVRAPTTPSGAALRERRSGAATSPRCALDERRARHDELDALIGAWSAPLDPPRGRRRAAGRRGAGRSGA